ncbi:MAG: septal ring lytic transglycosylase RlpA family protein [Cyanobacteria bacterium P01_D01_bin.73]
MSSFKLLKPLATATAIVSVLAVGPAESQVVNRASEGSSAIRVAQWQPSLAPSESASLPAPAQALDSNTASGTSRTATSVSIATPTITKVYAHEVDDQDAVTLYVRDIPVLTFLSGESTSSDDTTGETASEAANETANSDDSNSTSVAAPMERAQIVAQKLENLYGQLVQTESGADIRLEWDDTEEQYWITAGDRPVVALDKWTTAVQPTADLNADLVQTTNRLRRLVFGAEPIQYTSSRALSNPAVAVAAPAPAPEVVGGVVQSTQLGIASWYGGYFHGRRTASGERYNQNAMTAAHRHLPFGTRVRVVNLSNGRSTIVRINDRGPFIRGRIIDLSSAAAGQIGLRSMGIGRVRVEVLK